VLLRWIFFAFLTVLWLIGYNMAIISSRPVSAIANYTGSLSAFHPCN